jgi:hypothetical protein
MWRKSPPVPPFIFIYMGLRSDYIRQKRNRLTITSGNSGERDYARSMNSFTPIWSKIVDSSLWDEEDWVIKIFMTMLALKDSDYVYRGTAYALGRQARKTEGEILEAWKILSSPDTRRIEAQDFDGRRIESVEDGWLILNAEKYRNLVSDEMRKARLRRAQAAYRERERNKNDIATQLRKTELPGEAAAMAEARRRAREEDREADRKLAADAGLDYPGSDDDGPM